MDVDDFMEPEIALTAAVTAALFSPRARKVMRKGLVYGTAGVLAAGDAITSFARGFAHSVEQARSAAVSAAQQAQEEAKAAGTSASTESAAESESSAS